MKNQGNRSMLFGRLILTITILNFSNKITAMEAKTAQSSDKDTSNSFDLDFLTTPLESSDNATKSLDLVDMITTTNDISSYQATSQSNSRNNSRPSSPVAIFKATEPTHDNWGKTQEPHEPIRVLWARGDEPHGGWHSELREIKDHFGIEIEESSMIHYPADNESSPSENPSDSKQEITSNNNDHSNYKDDIGHELHNLTAELKDEGYIPDALTRTKHQDQASSINSSQLNPNAFFKQSEINSYENQQNYSAAKTCSCCKPIELPAASKEKINQVIEPIADLLVKENFQGHVNAATYKDYLNFVEKLLTLPSQTNPQNEYELAYLKNGIFELYFSQNGAMKFATPNGYAGEQLGNQIGIYLQNSLPPQENQTAVRHLDGMGTLNFKTIGYKEKVNEKLPDKHPDLGIFATKATVKNHALEFGKKVENNPANKELLGFVKLIKDEATSGNKESERKVLDFLAKNPNNKLAHKIYNERYAYKPSFCKYDPKIAQISTAEAVQRHKNVQTLIAKLNLDKDKVNVFLIKSFYEITDKDAPKNSLDVLLNLKINGNENLIDKIAQEESIHKNEPAVKNALEYLRLAALTRHNPENFNVRFLSFGINEALKNPNSDQTILHCNNFLDYPNKLNDAQIANKNIIINLAADACKKIYSEPNANNPAPVKQLKLANYLHNLNQDPQNSDILSVNIKTISDSMHKEYSDPEVVSNNLYQIAELAFDAQTQNSTTLNLITTPAVNFLPAVLLDSNSAKISQESRHSQFPVNAHAVDFMLIYGQNIKEITNFKPASILQLNMHNCIVEGINRQAAKIYTSENVTEQALALQLAGTFLKVHELNEKGQIGATKDLAGFYRQIAELSTEFATTFLSRLSHNAQHPIEYIKERVNGVKQLGIFIFDATFGQIFRTPQEQARFCEQLSRMINEFDKPLLEASAGDITRIIASAVADMVCDGVIGYVSKIAKDFAKQFATGVVAKIAKTVERVSEAVQTEKQATAITPEGFEFATNASQRSSGKLEKFAKDVSNKTDKITKREIESPKVQTYEQARNKALELLGDVDQNAGVPHIGNVGIGKNKIVGRKWFGNKASLRLDYDPIKGPHINVADFRLGKGAKGIEVYIPFDGNEETVKQLLSHLNTKNNLEWAKAVFDRTGNIDDAQIVMETLKDLGKKA